MQNDYKQYLSVLQKIADSKEKEPSGRYPRALMGSILKWLVDHGRRIAGIETVDRMTDRQIAAKVHNYFQRQGTGALILTAVDVRH